MLADLQQHLNDVYQVEPTCDVRDYVITDRILASLLGQQAMLTNSDETLLVAQDEDGLSLSLFLDEEMLDRLEAANPFDSLNSHQLDDFWKVIEGISHFNYVAWKAAQDREFSLLELELQAEVDKFILTMLLAIGQQDNEICSRLHGWLFDDVSFHADLDADEIHRYRTANEYAARFCRQLGDRLLQFDRIAFDELRAFYRLQLGDKISHIHSCSWASN